jgi:hypothetical protein
MLIKKGRVPQKRIYIFLLLLIALTITACSAIESLPSVKRYNESRNSTPLPDPHLLPESALANADPNTVEMQWEEYLFKFSPAINGGARVRTFQIVNSNRQLERRAYIFYGNSKTFYLGPLSSLVGAPVETIFFNYGKVGSDDGFMLGRVDDKIAAPSSVSIMASYQRNGAQVSKSGTVSFRYFLLPLFGKSGQGDNLNWIHALAIESAGDTILTRFEPPIEIASSGR